MKKVEIYSLPTCHICQKAKAYFKENSIEYIDYDMSDNKDRKEEMIKKSGQMRTPVILIDEKIMIGFDQTKFEELYNA